MSGQSSAGFWISPPRPAHTTTPPPPHTHRTSHHWQGFRHPDLLTPPRWTRLSVSALMACLALVSELARKLPRSGTILEPTNYSTLPVRFSSPKLFHTATLAGSAVSHPQNTLTRSTAGPPPVLVFPEARQRPGLAEGSGCCGDLRATPRASVAATGATDAC